MQEELLESVSRTAIAPPVVVKASDDPRLRRLQQRRAEESDEDDEEGGRARGRQAAAPQVSVWQHVVKHINSGDSPAFVYTGIAAGAVA